MAPSGKPVLGIDLSMQNTKCPRNTKLMQKKKKKVGFKVEVTETFNCQDHMFSTITRKCNPGVRGDQRNKIMFFYISKSILLLYLDKED